MIKEIRIHGRGGMGTVKAAEIIVYAMVKGGGFGVSVPFFGFERQGAPVVAYVKLASVPIRAKTQVYNPDCVMIMEPTLMKAVNVFADMKEEGTLILNTKKLPCELDLPPFLQNIVLVDATGIALNVLGRVLPNTAMLGAFVHGTNMVESDLALARIEELFGPANAHAFQRGMAEAKVFKLQGEKI